jgi:hypothetical protein
MVEETQHRLLFSSEGLIAVFDPIVEPPVGLVFADGTDSLQRCAIRREPIGYGGFGQTMAPERFPEECPRRSTP